ncbi:MAG: S8 family serine peptidase [Thermoplasmatota archaeon]
MRRWTPAIAVLLLFFPAAGPAAYEQDDPVLSKLSPSLENMGFDVRHGSVIPPRASENVPVLIHVNEYVPGGSADILRSMGAHLGYRFRALEVYQAEIPAAMVSELTEPDFVEYIEWDAPGTFDMDVSSGVVKAPQVWSSLIKDGIIKDRSISGRGIGIAVVDSGIDAGHPDLDYGEKTLMNIKAVQAGDPWVEMENSDTSVGHGSHCAGIAAGGGDASAGSRRGVAPGANLIGLSLTEGDEEVSTANYLYGLEWVYENSKPGANPYNIKVCTNSWHTTVGEYEPEMALSRIINKLTYENNVVCTFSAGNDGRNDPEGEEVWTSQQGNTPAAIMVAAYARDGTYVADFTSHGKVGWNHTYADVGAPGVRIWASHARRTGISAGSKLGGNPNPYYLAISGTSMSTPHVAGAVALLWEACPSMDVSRWAEDYNGSDPDWFYAHERRFVHDSELILEASAVPLPYVPDDGGETGIFVQDPTTGWGQRQIDYTQGYGMIDLDKAVGIALSLQMLRSRNPGMHVSVFDALNAYHGTMTRNLSCESSVLHAAWEGEYSRFNDQNDKPLVVQNQTKLIYIPEGTRSIELDLDYSTFSISDRSLGGITIEVDQDRDGEPDFDGGMPIISSPGTYRIPVGPTGVYYELTVKGQGFKLIRPIVDNSYVELRIDYNINIRMEVPGENISIGKGVYSSPINAFWDRGGSAGSGNITLERRIYDMQGIGDPWAEPDQEAEGREKGIPWTLVLVIVIIFILAAYLLVKRRKKKMSSLPEK